MSEFSVEDIQNFNPKVATDEQIDAYTKLKQVACDYNLELDDSLYYHAIKGEIKCMII